MRKFLTIFVGCWFLGCFSSVVWAEISVVDNGKYVEFRIPFSDMFGRERWQAINEGVAALLEGIREQFPQGRVDKGALDKLAENPEYLNGSIKAVRMWVKKERLAGINIVPSGFLVYVGGKFSANLKIGGGGSGVFAVVVVPLKIIRVSKITGRKYQRFTFDAAVVGIGTVNLGVGVGGGAAFRIGLGVIWGDLDMAEAFKGVSVGVSGSAQLGAGFSGKMHLLMRRVGVLTNLYLMLGYDVGVSATAEAHGNISAVIPIGTLMKSWMGEVDVEKLYDSYNKDATEVEPIDSIQEGRTGLDLPGKVSSLDGMAGRG